MQVKAGYCQSHQRDARGYDERRGSAHERGYNAQWRKARAVFLALNPLCLLCGREGRITPATVVDHIAPHRGDRALFWDEENWQPLCSHCHNSVKQRQERANGL